MFNQYNAILHPIFTNDVFDLITMELMALLLSHFLSLSNSIEHIRTCTGIYILSRTQYLNWLWFSSLNFNKKPMLFWIFMSSESGFASVIVHNLTLSFQELPSKSLPNLIRGINRVRRQKNSKFSDTPSPHLPPQDGLHFWVKLIYFFKIFSSQDT